MFTMVFTDLSKVSAFTLRVFEITERKFVYYFKCNFDEGDNINHCTEEDKLLLINIIFNVEKYYNMTDVYINDVVVAVLFAFYSLVLLELHGDCICLEEVCRFLRLREDAIKKIGEIFYGIIWGDDPVLAEVRGRVLMPLRYS